MSDTVGRSNGNRTQWFTCFIPMPFIAFAGNLSIYDHQMLPSLVLTFYIPYSQATFYTRLWNPNKV